MESKDLKFFESQIATQFFAIIDLETTGFSPNRGDKIVEIGIITTDMQGNVIESYETLINPNRDVGATNIHGITADMVKNAPKIEDVIDDIKYHLHNKTIVGHNLDFDLRFINHEFERLLKKQSEIKGLCTIQMSKVLLPDLPARRLECFCEYFDIQNTLVHSALGDCETTCQLFHILKDQYIDCYGIENFVENYVSPVTFNELTPPKNISLKRTESINLRNKENQKVFELINRLPANPSDSIPVQAYLNILDEILADRIINQSEVEILEDFILTSGLTKDQVIELHKEYLRKIVRVYLLDNFISDSEKKDLHKLCELLCIGDETIEKIIEYEKAKISEQSLPGKNNLDTSCIGKTVCFTGELTSKLNGMPIERMTAQQLAMERGLIIKSGVSSKLDYLVAADPNSLSGKARKARELGVIILAEPVFWNMIGIRFE
jgi:DNA polymerase-3 subunit epsilon